MRLKELSWIGTGLIALGAVCGGALAQDFPSRNIELLSNIPLSGFAFAPGNGSDCWGYTSPSGREYALMGLSNSVAFVEITDPRLPRKTQEGMLDNPAWSAHYLYENGTEVPGARDRFPRTFAALRDVPLCQLPQRSPSVARRHGWASAPLRRASTPRAPRCRTTRSPAVAGRPPSPMEHDRRPRWSPGGGGS